MRKYLLLGLFALMAIAPLAAFAEDAEIGGVTMPTVTAADVLGSATSYFALAIGIGLTLFAVVMGVKYIPSLVNKLRGR